MSAREELQLLQESVSKWLEGLPVEDFARGRVDGSETLLSGLGELGLAGIGAAEDVGGAGLGLQGIAVLCRELGRRGLRAPVVSNCLLAVDILSACNTDEARACLVQLVEGNRVLAVALPETMTALNCSDNGGVSGSWRYIADLKTADGLLVVIPNQQHMDILLLAASDLACAPLSMVDRSDFSHVTAVDVQGARLGSLRDALLVPQLTDRARLASAWEMIGLGENALAMTCEYLRVREQFGRKIGSYQALQHRLAKAYINLELAEASAAAALELQDTEEFSAAATVAKAIAGEALHLISNECVQMHGGIGMTDEHLAGHYLKRARVLETYLGGKAQLGDRFAVLNGY